MTNVSQTDAPQDLDAEIAELEYRGRRHAENLAGLRAMEAHQTSEIARLDAELVALADNQAQLPASADAASVHEAKKAIIDTELARDLMAEERARLQSELAATPKLIEDNTAAIEALKAKAGS
jgi:uncharacterized coiled-coil protein SlyX